METAAFVLLGGSLLSLVACAALLVICRALPYSKDGNGKAYKLLVTMNYMFAAYWIQLCLSNLLYMIHSFGQR